MPWGEDDILDAMLEFDFEAKWILDRFGTPSHCRGCRRGILVLACRENGNVYLFARAPRCFLDPIEAIQYAIQLARWREGLTHQWTVVSTTVH